MSILTLVEQLANLETFLKEEGYSVEDVNKIRDGRNKMQFYDVSIECAFEAETPEDAVKQMIDWLADEAQRAYYIANDENGVNHGVDMYDFAVGDL